ncbi:hypothetical protein CO058_02030 [candidate division WWE3 bacterium CG_4_9_14_0_2_um_filter_35_11]|uniref:Type 4 fimbrial biogenesis protein PilX N-terminal domain-containing protein n=1 Tax=candidate division WWE3 bacterium CG_4_9_14_0_2_um_filter_35_11 TaxID=1975077 RepID=A0A2M8EM08_UNCKA|nr:MAG: hypothetical protein COV25_03320 [candidate division WWE3 bacterium CG10_big_fil_rev_8_21_14_0_10_35_32]PJC23717.1 MAG: hypothetical protein CO058_02030 [candidate division WWE3 bacterium CG_4_9_14_0_2_um_filter_35_11]
MVKTNKLNSFGAILTVIIIGIFLTFLTVSASLQSQSRLQNIDAVYKKAKVLYLAESCVEDIMARSEGSQDIPETIELSNGTCEIIFDSHPVFKVIQVSATIESYTSKIEISMTLPPGQEENNGNNNEHGNNKFGVLYWYQVE